MNRIRINELAKELEVKANEIIDRLPELGVMDKKANSSSIDEDVAIKLRRMFERQDVAGAGTVPAAIDASHSIGSMNKFRINELAHELEVKAHEIIDRLPELGVMEKKTHSSSIDEDVAIKLRRIFGHEVPDELGVAGSAGTVTPPASPPLIPIRPMKLSLEVRDDDHQLPATPRSHPIRPPLSGLTIERVIPPYPPLQTTSAPETMPGDATLLTLPSSFTFSSKGFYDFNKVLQYFDWGIKESSVTIDLTTCDSANFQAMALLLQYAWQLSINGCSVVVKYGVAGMGPTKMLSKMGALSWREVLMEDGRDFEAGQSGNTFALRRRSDVQNTINKARNAINRYKLGFPDYLSYVISELLYNATEHGRRQAYLDRCQVLVPAIFQFGYYTALERFSFIFSDLGVGIKTHLEQTYPVFQSHQDAIIHALRPNVSGTFRQQSEPYAAKNNAGLGLTYSSQMLKRLKGDMYIVSHDGVVHVSPQDVTSHKLLHKWPGTFVLINLNIRETVGRSVEDLLAEIKDKAEEEVEGAAKLEQDNTFYVSIFNYFGKWAEDKDAAILFRDRHVLPAVAQGKRIELDFGGVETAPHSFLNALLATPIARLGPKAYQWIKVRNAPGAIREIIDGVFEDNLPRLK
jgi:hypothetical protein